MKHQELCEKRHPRKIRIPRKMTTFGSYCRHKDGITVKKGGGETRALHLLLLRLSLLPYPQNYTRLLSLSVLLIIFICDSHFRYFVKEVISEVSTKNFKRTPHSLAKVYIKTPIVKATTAEIRSKRRFWGLKS